MFTVSHLFASLLWCSIGLGYLIYGKKQQSISALVGGILMVVAAYFCTSVLAMSVTCAGIAAAVYFLSKMGT